MPSRKHSQEHFSTDSTARKPNLKRDSSRAQPPTGGAHRCCVTREPSTDCDLGVRARAELALRVC